ncbi:hypothetical protein EYF80_025571 [Liparis tanakae]|uniref:Uncharacterized protein n=1 Tax=Liparis tanakae TaxID=230148 RepID=A0A4Z2HGW3_9TELE|nr:hypothetical protein EYF80_025571 [Liparis tanakae]
MLGLNPSAVHLRLLEEDSAAVEEEEQLMEKEAAAYGCCLSLRDTFIDSRTCSQVVSGIGRKQRSAVEQHGEEEEEEEEEAADSTFSFGDSLQNCGGVFL